MKMDKVAWTQIKILIISSSLYYDVELDFNENWS